MGGGRRGEIGVVEHVAGEGRPKMRVWGEVSQTRALVHGEDFMMAAPKRGAERVKKSMKECYEFKVRAVLERDADDYEVCHVGPDGEVDQGGGVELEAGEKHGKLIIEELGLVPGSNGVVSLAVRM